MKILAVADHEHKGLWDYFEKSKLEGIDLIISCGDLDPRFLSFLATFTNAPVLYVHGNHDGGYDKMPPEGCICIEDKVYVHQGVRILGLGGSMLYSGGDHQYTEKQMQRRIRRLGFRLRRAGGIDILVTHSPSFQINDGTDLPHKGFACFRELLEKYHPKYHLHGHVHMNYGRQHRRKDTYGDTTIVNAYERCVIDYESGEILT